MRGDPRIARTTDTTACTGETHFCFIRDTPRVFKIGDKIFVVHVAKLCEVNVFFLAREGEAELTYVRYSIDCERSQLEGVRTLQGIVVPVFSSSDDSLEKAYKPGK